MDEIDGREEERGDRDRGEKRKLKSGDGQILGRINEESFVDSIQNSVKINLLLEYR